MLGTAIAAWSAAHGFAVLWLNGNLPTELTEDLDAVASLVANGMAALGDITRRQATSLPPASRLDPTASVRRLNW